MATLPVLPGERVVRALTSGGFEVVRVRGSHHVLRRPDGRGHDRPGARHQEVRAGTLRSILRDCGLTVEQFLDLLE